MNDLSAFNGAGADILEIGQSDVQLIGGLISECMTKAKWDVRSSSVEGTSVAAVGIFVGVRPGSGSSIVKAASALVLDLVSFGVPATLYPFEKMQFRGAVGLMGDVQFKNPILIVIGSKT